MSPFLYVPIIIILEFFIMALSFYSNSIYYTDGGRKWFYINIAVSCLTAPLWASIAYYSKNMVFDSILYDVTVALSCVIFAVYFSNKFSHYLNIPQIIGLIIIIIGFLVFKFGEIFE